MLHWKDLVWKSDEQLAALDIAVTNLACAADFPDAPTPAMVEECVQRLDHYASTIKPYTEQQQPRFYANRAYYHDSEARFRVVTMISVLQKVFGVRYNPAKIPEEAPFETEDSFVHGPLLGEGGTCASLPVVYAAVGRRMGYPVKLVTVKSHLLCRWDSPGGERFNIEANNFSIDDPSDDKYREGRHEVHPGLEKAFCYLRSQTPRQEVSGFLTQRGCRWHNLGRHKEAMESFVWACVLAPDNKAPQVCALEVMRQWRERLTALMPPNFPEMTVGYPLLRRFPFAVIPEKLEQHMILCEKWTSPGFVESGLRV